MTTGRQMWIPLVGMLLMAGCGGSSDKDSGSSQAGPGSLELLSYTADPPASWTQQPPSNRMRLAEFTLPAAGGGEAPRAFVFFFGKGQGGTVEANLARWSRQVTDDQGNPVEPDVTKPSDSGFPTTVATYQGTYTRTRGMGGAPSEPEPNTTMLAAIMETPEGTLFIQLTGSTPAVEAERENFLAFVKSVR